jgi:hypothetical protein
MVSPHSTLAPASPVSQMLALVLYGKRSSANPVRARFVVHALHHAGLPLWKHLFETRENHVPACRCKQRVQGNEGNIPADVLLGTVALVVPDPDLAGRTCASHGLKPPASSDPALLRCSNGRHLTPLRHLGLTSSPHSLPQSCAVTCGSAALLPSILFLYLQVTLLHTTACHGPTRFEHTAALSTAITLSFKRHLT